MAAGKISAVSTNTITIRSAKLTPDSLSSGSTPYAVRILTGNAAGEWLPVITNTVDTLVVLASDLRASGISAGTEGDIAEIVRVHTLDSFFGSQPLLGGGTAADADIVYLGTTTLDSYYFNSTDKKWRRVSGPTTYDAGSTIIPPQGLIQIERKGPATSIIAVGRVAETPFTVNIANSGNTFANAGTLGETTLASLAFQRCIPNWVSSLSAAFADKIAVGSSSGWHLYYHNGTNWIDSASSSGAIADSVILPIGAPIMISRPGNAAGFTKLVLPIPVAGLSLL